MKCAHCQVEIHESFYQDHLRSGSIGTENGIATNFFALSMECPACKQALIKCVKRLGHLQRDWYVYPLGSTRPAAPAEVPTELAEDFNEAAAVLEISPKASAALSRRCMQALLRQQGFTQKDLAPAIQAAIDQKHLPPALADNLDVVRNVGNFASHPIKDHNSGAIVAVEPDEAEWNLEVLEGLFNHYYVQPAKDKARRDALNAKLLAAKKPPLKA